MEDQAGKRFLKTWAYTCLGVAALVVLFAALMDPYCVLGFPRVSQFNSRKPGAAIQDRLAKAYDVVRRRHSTIILGGSRVAVGLDASSSTWPAYTRPVYNMGLNASAPYVSYRYLQHVMAKQRVPLVLLGLEFEYFMGLRDEARPGAFESSLLIAADGSALKQRGWQYARDVFGATFSLDAAGDSVKTLNANLTGALPELGYIDAAGNEIFDLRRRASRLGQHYMYQSIDVAMIQLFRGKHVSQAVMQDVQSILNLCQSRGTRVIVFINPVHADLLEIYRLSGQWSMFEEWKRELVSIVSRYSNRGEDIQLWDFNGYYKYTTESVSVRGEVLRWMPDPLHYTKELGGLIVGRVFGGGDPHYGVLLNLDNIETHLTSVREQQRQYHNLHQEDVERVRALYIEVTS